MDGGIVQSGGIAHADDAGGRMEVIAVGFGQPPDPHAAVRIGRFGEGRIGRQ